jgi:tetratricopeptide (TPR) repeat protein
MNILNEKYSPSQLPPDELSEREKQLLQAHLNLERAARWRKLAGPKPMSLRAIFGGQKWLWWVAALLLGAMICWKTDLFSTQEKTEKTLLAARTGLIEYPFENITVRGGQAGQGSRPAKALESYRKNDFETALREAAPNDHFFIGVCWLQLGNAQNALTEFEQTNLEDDRIGDEFFYYKGVALQDLGRFEEAKNAFQRILDSKTIREPFRASTIKRMGK